MPTSNSIPAELDYVLLLFARHYFRKQLAGGRR